MPLPEGDVGPERSLEGEAGPARDVLGDEGLALGVGLSPDLRPDSKVGAAIELGAAVVDVEVVNSAAATGKSEDLPLPEGPATTCITGRSQCPPSCPVERRS